jgi:FimV-like protein
MSTTGEKSFLQELWEKGFIRLIISYLLGAWAILQFVDWLVVRYHVSALWTDVVFAFFIAMLPSVFLYTYFHNSSKIRSWRKWERIVIPSNFLIALVVVFLLFSGKSMGATANKVTVTDESGEEFERFVPTTKMVRRMLFFPAQTQGLDESEQWLKLALPNLQSLDIQQDNRLYPISSFYLHDVLVRHGYDLNQKIPIAVQKDIAEEYYTNYFVESSIKKNGDQYQVSYEAYTTEDGKSFFSKSYEGTDIFDIIDQFSQEFEGAIYLKEANSEQNKIVDLPAENLISTNTQVIQDFQNAYLKNYVENEPEEAIKLLKQAVQKDPNCAICYRYLATSYHRVKNDQARDQALEEALNKSRVLPERMQLDIKYFYYYYAENTGKAITLLEMWRKLYPSDYIPYARLMNLYRNRLEHDQAVAVGKEAIAAGHSGFILTSLASIYMYQGKIEEAVETYKRFEAEYPKRINETTQLGYLYRRQGQLEKAKAHFEKIHLLDPRNYLSVGSLAQLEGDLGNYEKSYEYYQQALENAKLAKDSSRVMQWIQYHHLRLGQVNRAIELMEERFELESTYLTPYQVRSELVSPDVFSMFESIDRVEEHYQNAKAYINQYYPDDEKRVCFLELINALFGDAGQMQSVFEGCQDAYEEDASENEIILVQAFLAKNRGDYDAAIEIFGAIVAEAPSYYFQRMLGQSYTEAKQYDKAVETYNNILVGEPNQPEVFLDLAETYLEKGDNDQAREYLEKALEVWKDADEEFIPAKNAREKLNAI